MNSQTLYSNSQLSRMLSDGAKLAAIDAVTLLESGFNVAAKAMVKDYGLTYLDLVFAGQKLNNCEHVCKAEALELLDLLSTEKARLLALRSAQNRAYSQA